ENYTAALSDTDELATWADEKGAMLWKAAGKAFRGCVMALTGNAAEAISTITTGMAEMRSTGATLWLPLVLTYLAKAQAEVGQIGDAWRCMGEAMSAVEASGEFWCEAEVNRVAGEIALKSRLPDRAKADGYFERALSIARERQAKILELRAAMSLARLWAR